MKHVLVLARTPSVYASLRRSIGFQLFCDSFSMEYTQFESGYTDLISYDSGTDDDVARFSADSNSLRLGVNYRF